MGSPGGIGLISSPDGRFLVYKYAATLHRSGENELLLWQGIQYAKDNDFSYFDMSQMTLTEDKKATAIGCFNSRESLAVNWSTSTPTSDLRGRS